MSEEGKNLEGQVIDGKFPLLRYLGESDHSVVFLTERKQEPRKAAIKLVPTATGEAATQISTWEAAAKLSHPNLIKLFETGPCQLAGQACCYAVMEYAEENLYQILPDRPLSPDEARQMLPPVLDALRHLHRQGFVHGHIKPSNILASQDQIKLSSDRILRISQLAATPRTPSLYDPPEPPGTGSPPARDIWSLGVTVVEALTQHPPSFIEGKELPPQSLPAPFADIVRNCLRLRPEQRWLVDQIADTLNPPTVSSPVPSVQTRQATQPVPTRTVQSPRPPARVEVAKQPTFAKPGRMIAAIFIALVVLVFLFTKLLHHGSVSQSPAVSSAPPTSSANPSPTSPVPVARENAPARPSAPPAAAPAEAPDSESSGAIIHKVLPNVPRSASRTIHGIIRVEVEDKVKPDGAVSSATLVSAGSSPYFAKLALEAARKWRFEPGQADGKDPSTTWILVFEFRQRGASAYADPAK